jgi:hypothetical protein
MNQIIWKNKLQVLWILQMFNFLAVLVMPEAMAAVTVQMGGALGTVISFYFLLTCLMIWMAAFLKPAASRWPMMVVAALYAFVKISWIVKALSGEVMGAMLINETWGLLTALLIVWYGWNKPGSDPAR